MKPCPECWVEAQRREAAGEHLETAYGEVLLWCPAFHDATPLPEGAGSPW